MEMSVRWEVAQFFERRWWKGYLADKTPDVYLQWKKGYWQGVLDKLKKVHPQLQKLLNTPHLDILDAGCGPAGTFLALDDHQVQAIDPLWSYYAKEFQQLGHEGLDYVHFEQGLLEDFEAKDQFDLVFCMNALNHVDDIEKAAQNLSDALKPDGWLICSLDVHNYEMPKSLFRAIPGDVMHPHQYNITEYIDLIESPDLCFTASANLRRGQLFDHQMLVFKKV